MNHGGRRPGAGRKLGSVSKRTRQFRAEVAKAGCTPLEHMLAVLHDENADPERRDRMAIAAAPFVHPRLSVVDAKVVAEANVMPQLNDAERREKARQMILEAFAERPAIPDLRVVADREVPQGVGPDMGRGKVIDTITLRGSEKTPE